MLGRRVHLTVKPNEDSWGIVGVKSQPRKNRLVITTDKQTGLPVIRSRHPAPRAEEMTPERVDQILLAQEVEWQRKAAE